MKQLLNIAAVILFFTSCNEKEAYDVGEDKPYEKSKTNLASTERKNPVHFLAASGTKRKNFLRQTVVLGKVYNNARMVTYKDVEVLVSFYSKTGTVMEEDHVTVYENVVPGGIVNFKEKLFIPKDADSMGMKVLSAKF